MKNQKAATSAANAEWRKAVHEGRVVRFANGLTLRSFPTVQAARDVADLCEGNQIAACACVLCAAKAWQVPPYQGEPMSRFEPSHHSPDERQAIGGAYSVIVLCIAAFPGKEGPGYSFGVTVIRAWLMPWECIERAAEYISAGAIHITLSPPGNASSWYYDAPKQVTRFPKIQTRRTAPGAR